MIGVGVGLPENQRAGRHGDNAAGEPGDRGSAAAIDMREHADSHRPDRGEADEVAGVPVGSSSVTTVSFAAADVCTAGGQMV